MSKGCHFGDPGLSDIPCLLQFLLDIKAKFYTSSKLQITYWLIWQLPASLTQGAWNRVTTHFISILIIIGLTRNNILGDPGATSRDDAIFLGESLLQELKSPWELILTEPVLEVVEFRPADYQKNIFLAHQGLLSSRSKLSPENIASSRLEAPGFSRMRE